MAYETPTVDDFRDKFPEFDEEYRSDAEIQEALDMASRRVDTTWLEGDYANAILYLAAHLLAVTEFGADSLGQDNLRSISIGPLSLSYGKALAAGDWATTTYGQQYKILLSLNIPAIRVI